MPCISCIHAHDYAELRVACQVCYALHGGAVYGMELFTQLAQDMFHLVPPRLETSEHSDGAAALRPSWYSRLGPGANPQELHQAALVWAAK